MKGKYIMKKNFKLIIALIVIVVLALIGSGSMWVPKVAPNTTNPVLKFIGGVDFFELAKPKTVLNFTVNLVT